VAHRFDPHKLPAVQDAVRRIEAKLGTTGRIVLRASGTEPLIRVMIEAQDEAQARSAAEDLATTVRAAAA